MVGAFRHASRLRGGRPRFIIRGSFHQSARRTLAWQQIWHPLRRTKPQTPHRCLMSGQNLECSFGVGLRLLQQNCHITLLQEHLLVLLFVFNDWAYRC